MFAIIYFCFFKTDEGRTSIGNSSINTNSSVKFECCDQFWPCHRCHNNSSTCCKRERESRDAQAQKCVHCNEVQKEVTIISNSLRTSKYRQTIMVPAPIAGIPAIKFSYQN